MYLKRGQIVFVDFGKGIGSEQGGVRPALIVSNNIGNRTANTIVVVPCTSKIKTKIPTHHYIKSVKMPKPSTALCEQLRVVDKKRVSSIYCTLSKEEMEEIGEKIKLQLGI